MVILLMRNNSESSKTPILHELKHSICFACLPSFAKQIIVGLQFFTQKVFYLKSIFERLSLLKKNRFYSLIDQDQFKFTRLMSMISLYIFQRKIILKIIFKNIINQMSIINNQQYQTMEIMPQKKSNQSAVIQQNAQVLKNDEEQQSEDLIMDQIKLIGSQIFEGESYLGENGELLLDFEEKFLKINEQTKQSSTNLVYNESRKYSYTERVKNEDDDDEWISEKDHHHQLLSSFSNKYHEQRIEKKVTNKNKQKQHQKHPQKQSNPQKAQHIPSANNKNRQNFKKVQKGTKQPINFKTHLKARTTVISSETPNYLKPTKHLKPEILQQIYQKKLKQQEELQQSRFTNKNSETYSTLDQLYKQKMPLYEKYLQDSQMKKVKMSISRIEQEQKQILEFVGAPLINTNIEVRGNFQERKKIKNIEKQANKAKIISEVMQSYTFKPKLTTNRKYEKIKTNIPTQWKNKGKCQQKQIQYDYQFYTENGGAMKGLSQECIKTNSFFSDDDNTQTSHKYPNSEIKLKNTNQLSYILELEDFEEG